MGSVASARAGAEINACYLTGREIDVIIESPVDYTKAEKSIRYARLENQEIPIIDNPDLIMMKQQTSRKQDDSDIRYLREKLNER